MLPVRRIRELLKRAEGVLAAQRAATRYGARVVPGTTYEEFATGVAKILAEEPDGNFLFVPEQEPFDQYILRTTGRTVEQHETEWLAKRAEHTQDNE